MKRQKPASQNIAAYNIQWLLALSAAIIFLLAYVTKDTFRNLKKGLFKKIKIRS
jgi:hypothetical protein